jgi:hypothetical protein
MLGEGKFWFRVPGARGPGSVGPGRLYGVDPSKPHQTTSDRHETLRGCSRDLVGTFGVTVGLARVNSLTGPSTGGRST